MDKLYNWSIARSGATMTITHSTGKISGIVNVSPAYDGKTRDGENAVLALRNDGARFVLVLG